MHPRFLTNHIAATVEPGELLVFSDLQLQAFEGQTLVDVAAHLDGSHSAEELAAILQDKCNAMELHYALEVLGRAGVLQTESPTPPVDGSNGGYLVPTEVTTLVVVDSYRRSRPEHLPDDWTLVRVGHDDTYIGPRFSPGPSACFGCLRLRIRENHPYQEFVDTQGGRVLQDLGAIRFPGELSDILERARPLVSDDLRLDHIRVLTSGEEHRVLPHPECERCSAKIEVESPSADTVVERDGGYRTVTPDQTLARLATVVSPLTGIVDAIRPMDPTGNLAVYSAAHPFPHRLQDPTFQAAGFRSRSTGKGRTKAQAEASALCEAVERYCGLYRGQPASWHARLDELDEPGIHPDDCLLFSDAQFANRHELNRDGHRFNWIPERYDPARSIDWTRAESLTHSRRVLVPSAYCWYGYPLPAGHDFCRADSNGNAAGNTKEEATLQGFLELVERDAVALWWYNQASRPAADVDGSGEWFAKTRRQYENLGRSMHVLDLTTDLAIPCYAAVSLGAEPDDLILGFGAHLDAEIALSRAVTEMNQFLPSLDNPRRARVTSHRLDDPLFLHPHGNAAPLASAEISTIHDALHLCLERARRRDLEVLVVDQTQPDVGFPVVKVIVPGLRLFWARLAPGRLYDVPVALGWQPRPLPENRMNPVQLVI